MLKLKEFYYEELVIFVCYKIIVLIILLYLNQIGIVTNSMNMYI